MKEKQIDKKVLLYSGGMDSFLAAHFWQPDFLLYCDVAHKYRDKELLTMEKI